MPRRAKGPRLYLQAARRDERGVVIEQAVWVIRDGTAKRSTGVGDEQAGSPPQSAIDALAEYLSARKAPRIPDRDPSQVLIADAIAVYAEDIAPKHARRKDTADRLGRILTFAAGKTFDEINQQFCDDYTKQRGSDAAARRELEDLRAACRHYWKQGLVRSAPPVVLPPKAEARDGWLTRKQAAKLIWTAWRHRARVRSGRSVRKIGWLNSRHIARFILIGLYTGTRAGAICGAALEPTPGHGWVDLENGVFYRKAIGRKKTKKRQPSVRIPPRLLAHMRRWKAKRIVRHHLIEWEHIPVLRVSKGFASVAEAAELAWCHPHLLRHTAITWQAQLGVPPHEICGFFGITMKMFEEVYAHHHPDFQSNAVNALNKSRATAPKSNVVKLTG